MSNVLLIEPNYKNKYPPIGLMKLATFHKTILHDYVRFAKGRLPEALSNGKWDRIYVTSLFTFEWAETIRAIHYALTLVDSPDKVVVGGIAATLMPDQIYAETGIHPVCGLLNEKNKLGIPGEECIDSLVPDYAILKDIEKQYIYPYHDAYFLSATKGCGMKCGFCAVQTLEPKFEPYLEIKEKIKAIDNQYGPKKDLLLMDNNVLRSSRFNQIIDDIIEAGFAKGAFHINPKTGKRVNRYVDFNQGLDAHLLTPEKARRLGQIALNPARIAFDHIEDRGTYERAIRLCTDNGITELSNYLLYNSEEFSGKGNFYQADAPEDLYTRMRITLDLKDNINKVLPDECKVKVFSFPMRYIPLSARERGYVGSKWNPKFLRAVQCMLIPTQGKGVGSRSFFEADFGRDENEFIRFLCMPERLISARGNIELGVRGRKDETSDQTEMRKKRWEQNQIRLHEWNRLFDSLADERNEFVEKISDNEFLPEKVLSLRTEKQKALYLHYLTEPRIFTLLGKVGKGSPTREAIFKYVTRDFHTIYENLISLLITSDSQQQYMIKNFINFFGKDGLYDLLRGLEVIDFDADKQMAIWVKSLKSADMLPVDFELFRIYRRYVELEALPDEAHHKAKEAICMFSMQTLGGILHKNFNIFCSKLTERCAGENGETAIAQAVYVILNNIQMKIQDLMEVSL